VDFGVAFEKKCAAFSYGKGNFNANVFFLLGRYVKSFFRHPTSEDLIITLG
jgi:hypothetical protein